MKQKKDIIPIPLNFGCDTETYNDNGEYGLKSIQIWGKDQNQYFTTDNWEQSSLSIRFEICEKFFNFLYEQKNNINIAFFNLTFDCSQFLYWLVTKSGYEIQTDGLIVGKGQIQILESDRKVYLIQIRTFDGFLIRMIDLANFLVGVNLDNACKSWLGRGKVAIESKTFPKKASTPIEIEYAMEDSHLTYDLYLELMDFGVIEGHKNVTIAGRTMQHFKSYLFERFGLTFDQYFYLGANADEVEQMKKLIEDEIRQGVKGAICQAWQYGTFDNCIHIDAKSMYPTQCVRDFIPIGGLLKEPPDQKYTTIVYPSGFYTLKPNRVPCVQWRSKNNASRYSYLNVYDVGDFVQDFYLDGSYPIWIEEYEIIKECYDVQQEEINKRWYIRLAKNEVLKPYVQELYKGKQTNKGSKKLYYKYLLNSLYGKYLTRPDGVGISYVQINGDWKRIKTVGEKKTYYVPLGSWIAMMGRVTLMKAIISVCDLYGANSFLYCDTDSLIIKKPAMANVEIGENLGQWGIECDNVKVNIVGAKTYQELLEDGKVITKCGGLPTREKQKLKWLELKDGLIVNTAKPRRNPDTWEINIKDTEFTVSARNGLFSQR